MCVKSCPTGTDVDCNKDYYSKPMNGKPAFFEAGGNCTQPFSISLTAGDSSLDGLGFNKNYP